MPATLDPATALVLIDLQHGITGMVLGGISTSIGVESTARGANERGHELTIVTDALMGWGEAPLVLRQHFVILGMRPASCSAAECRASSPTVPCRADPCLVRLAGGTAETRGTSPALTARRARTRGVHARIRPYNDSGIGRP